MTDGTYKARAKEITIGASRGGTLQVTIKFELMQLNGGFKFWNGYYTAKAKPFTLDAIQTAGIADDFAALTPEQNHKFVNGPEVELVLETEVYEGKEKQKVKYINRVGGAQFIGKNPEVWKGVDLKNDMKAHQMTNPISDFAPSEEMF